MSGKGCIFSFFYLKAYIVQSKLLIAAVSETDIISLYTVKFGIVKVFDLPAVHDLFRAVIFKFFCFAKSFGARRHGVKLRQIACDIGKR